MPALRLVRLLAVLMFALATEEEPAGTIRGSVTLHNGVELPLLGFGTAGLMGRTRESVRAAIAAGFRAFDTAQATEWYREADVGAALAASGVARERFFVTTKMHPRDHGYQTTRRRVAESAAALGGRVELFLLHYAECWPGLCGAAHRPAGTWRDSWRALEDALADGDVQAIGVSNFRPEQLRELVEGAATRVKPHVVQSWMDPLHQDAPLRALCAEHGVAFTACGPPTLLLLSARGLARGLAARARLSSCLGNR